jgi:hypothetical protein
MFLLCSHISRDEDAEPPDARITDIDMTADCTGVELEEGRHGRRAVITSTWSDAILEWLVEADIAELELNWAKGWAGRDLSFLPRLPRLRSLAIVDRWLSSVEPIHALHELRHLGLNVISSRTKLDFSAFPHLRECTFSWLPGTRSLFECTTLETLALRGYRGLDFAPFGDLRNLEWLDIYRAPFVDLKGVGGLKKLRTLHLGDLRRLASLSDLERAIELEWLFFQSCRGIHAIDEVRHLSGLQNFDLDKCGDIASLTPLRDLPNLRRVSFVETNIVDGDLSFLVNKPGLQRISFGNRRHYSHRREEFRAYTKG